jgi:galactonate dehydratase
MSVDSSITRRTLLRRGAAAAAVTPLGTISPLLEHASATARNELRIAKVEPYVIRIGRRKNIVCARVETEDGLHGWGEGTTPPNVAPVVAQIRSLGDLIKGQRAWDTEKLWRKMYTVEENTLGGTLYAGISAIDIALWDIVAKYLEVPLYDLLGGKVWDQLRLYASYRWGNIPRTASAYRKRTEELIAEGAVAGKYDPFGPYPEPSRQLPTSTLNEVREMIRGIREASTDFDICVECHGKFNVASAGRIILALQEYDLFFLEEPVPPENVDAMAELQRSTNIPIAAGEGVQGHFLYRELLAKRSARIWQPDVARVGGVTAMKKIAALADTGYVTVAPHNPNGPICAAASIQLAASIPNFLIMEEGNKETKQYKEIFVDGWDQKLGYWTVPSTPGIGVDLSPELLREYEVKLDV